MKRIVFALLSIVTAAPLFAGLSAKYKDWPSTPQGYFMTASERATWATLTSDADNKKFVQQFLAVRGGSFPAEVAKRAEMADKYLTIGKTPGSKTLRGKTIILLGPPAAMDVRDAVEGEGETNSRAFGQAVSRSGADTGVGDSAHSAASAGGMRINDSMQSTARNVEAVRARRYYSFTFQNDLVKKLDKSSLVVGVVADSTDGKDEFASRAIAADAQKAFETAAQMSIVKPQS